jgi:Ser/Thr protein kinase RdoA (MazF antagonist)
MLERCGRVLGALHRLEPPAWSDLRIAGPEDLLGKLRRDIAILVDAGVLETGLGRAAVATAAAAAPLDAPAGVIHKDFCADNIVADRSGAPVSIDNANLTFGPLDLDLARTWYRWPMSARDWSCFARGYEASRPTAGFRAHLPFWAVVVLAGSASSRLRQRIGRHGEPLERLRTILEQGIRPALGPA